MLDSEDSNFSEDESERSSEAEEVENEAEEEHASVVGSEKEEEEEKEEDYNEEEEEDDDDRPPKKPRHGGFILDEADVDDEYEDEDQWEDGAEDILENEEIEASNIDDVVLDEDRSGKSGASKRKAAKDAEKELEKIPKLSTYFALQSNVQVQAHETDSASSDESYLEVSRSASSEIEGEASCSTKQTVTDIPAAAGKEVSESEPTD
ncbi:uncharacterized protein ACDP82_010761 isoform 1-T4 [Pangshura tecta]